MTCQGCIAGLAKDTWQIPDPSGFEEKEKSILQFKDIGIVLEGGYRDACTGPIAFIGIIIPIIPMPCMNQEPFRNYWISLMIFPEEENEFSIDFRKVEINENGRKHIPTKLTIIGTPSPNTTSYNARRPVPVCDLLKVRPTYYFSKGEKHFISEISNPNGICAHLSFSTLPAKFTEEFSVAINGLTKNEIPYPFPPIRVVTKSEWIYSPLGN